MTDNKKGIVKRFRPDGWEALVPGMVKDCIAAGELEPISEEERPNIEAFIRFCLNLGADAAIEGMRALGLDAVVKNHQVLFILSKIAVPGRPQYKPAGMSYRDQMNYNGPGKITFIPADKEVFKIPPGKLSGGGNGGNDETTDQVDKS